MTVLRDEKGMSLIEVLVAMMLLAIVSLALIQSSLLAMNTNAMNDVRDEAVSVAEERMTELRNTPFSAPDMLVTGPSGTTEPKITRKVRAAAYEFRPVRTVRSVNAISRQITVTVSWNYRGREYRHGVSTVVRQQ